MRRKILVLGSIAAIVVAVVTLVWFQPQKLFLDQTVNETPVTTEPSRTAEATPADVREGEFTSLEHETTGRAQIRGNVLRLEDFETSNGPDLVVWLSAGEDGTYADDFVDLGPLKGNRGDQNYEIPPGTDLDRYDTAVIWCRRFTVGFGAAELS